MGTEIKSEPLPILDDLLQCPVCYDIPSGQIFQCNEGHHVCGGCKARLDQCPVCRALFFGTRNYAMEELIASLRKLKAFQLGGKTTVTFGSGGSESTTSADNSSAGAALEGAVEREDNEGSVTQLRAPAACKGLFRCLCCNNGNSERLPAARLLNHLRYFHSRDLLEGKSEGGVYVQAWQIATVPGRIVIAVRVTDMGIFFLVFEISNFTINAWVSMAAAPWVAHEFAYTVTISGNDREAIFTDCVWSVRSCEGALKKRGRCLTVSGSDVRALIAAANVSGRLTLRRAPDDQLAQHAQPRAVLRVASRGTGAAATAAPPPNPARDLEPFLQGLQNDVARLRTFATLGREANALGRSEAVLRSSIENGMRSNNNANSSPVNRNADTPSSNGTPNVEHSQLSRNARRRMRQRLRAALNENQPSSNNTGNPPRNQNSQASRPQQNAALNNNNFRNQFELASNQPPVPPPNYDGPSNGNDTQRRRNKRRPRR